MRTTMHSYFGLFQPLLSRFRNINPYSKISVSNASFPISFKSSNFSSSELNVIVDNFENGKGKKNETISVLLTKYSNSGIAAK